MHTLTQQTSVLPQAALLMPGLLEIWNIQLSRCSSHSPEGAAFLSAAATLFPVGWPLLVLVSVFLDVTRATTHLSSLTLQ